MIDDIRAAFARRLPRYELTSIVPLGEGQENVAYEVGGELVVRRSKEADPAARVAAARREAALLTAVAALSSLPVPEPVFVDEASALLCYRKVPGVPLHLNPVARPAELAAPLAGFLTGLHRADVGVLGSLVEVDDQPMAGWLTDAVESYRQLDGVLDAAARARVEAFLAAPPPAGPRALTFCHNDIGAEHVLVDVAANAVTGVIDWTDAAIADPAYDFGRLYRDLGPDVFELMTAGYEGEADAVDRERVAFYARCSLLEDIAFGVTTGSRQYAYLGLAHLDRTFD